MLAGNGLVAETVTHDKQLYQLTTTKPALLYDSVQKRLCAPGGPGGREGPGFFTLLRFSVPHALVLGQLLRAV